MKIICVGRNYVDHAKELNNEVPKDPVIFLKPKSALLKKGLAVKYPDFTDDLHYEAEMVLKICKNGKSIDAAAAKEYYQEWTVGIDFTARDVQSKLKAKGLPWELAKGFDNSAVVGDFIPVDFSKINNTNFSLKKNETIVQEGNTSLMIFSFDDIIAFVSKYYTLQIGDLIFTGTPAGVGPVLPYDELQGYIEDQELFNISVI